MLKTGEGGVGREKEQRRGAPGSGEAQATEADQDGERAPAGRENGMGAEEKGKGTKAKHRFNAQKDAAKGETTGLTLTEAHRDDMTKLRVGWRPSLLVKDGIIGTAMSLRPLNLNLVLPWDYRRSLHRSRVFLSVKDSPACSYLRVVIQPDAVYEDPPILLGDWEHDMPEIYWAGYFGEKLDLVKPPSEG